MVSVPVFVSSTFRDFHGERDVLRERVVPALDEALRPLGARVELLDLRWGIDTSGLSEEQSHQLVLDVCVRELLRCRPLFLGLVGDRFGWIPTRDRLERASAVAGGSSDLPQVPLSVTALEFWHGVLSPQAQSDAIVAIRHLAGEPPADWHDLDTDKTRWLRAALTQAKSRANDHVQVLDYVAHARANGEVLREDLDVFAEHVIHALQPRVIARALELGVADRGYTAAAELFVEQRGVMAGRRRLVDRVADALAEAGRGVVLSGAPGVGKSTILVALQERFRDQGWRVATVFAGAGPESTSNADVIRLLCQQLNLDIPMAEYDSTAQVGQGTRQLVGDQLLAWWAGQLAMMPEQTLIVVDGLDRLDSGNPRDNIEVLRGVPSDGVRLLTTTTLPEQVDVLCGRGLSHVPVGLLEPNSAGEGARALAAEVGSRTLPDRVVDVIASQPRNGLWLKMAVTELTWLDRTDFIRAEAAAASGADPAEALIDLLASQAQALPGDLIALANRLMDRAAGQLEDRDRAELLFGALAATRSGLSPADLTKLAVGESELRVARFRQLLGPQLATRDSTGRLAFDHQVVRTAARIRAGSAGWPSRSIHKRLALLLSAANHSNSVAETRDPASVLDALWHALMSGDSGLTADAISCTWATPGLGEEATQVIAKAIADGRGAEGAGLAAIQGLERIGAGCNATVLNMLVLTEQTRGTTDLLLTERRCLIDASLRIARQLSAAEPTDHDAAVGLCICLHSADEVATLEGRHDASAECCDEALTIARRLADGGSSDDALLLAVSLLRSGTAAARRGRMYAARGCYVEASNVVNRVASQADSLDSSTALILIQSLTAVSDVARAAGQTATALDRASQALRIVRRLHSARQGDLEAALLLSQTLISCASLERLVGDAASSQAHLGQALAIAQDLARAEPANPIHIRQLGNVLTDLGDQDIRSGHLERAKAHLSQAVKLARASTLHDPQNVFLVSNLCFTLSRAGEAQRRAGQLDEARTALTECLVLMREALASQPENNEAARQLIYTLAKLGEVELSAERLNAASVWFTQALSGAHEIAARDPGNVEARRLKSDVCTRLGDVERRQRRTDHARARFIEASEIAAEISDADRANTDAAQHLSQVLLRIGDLDRRDGDMQAACLNMRSAVKAARRAAEGCVEDTAAASNLSFVLTEASTTYLDADDPDRAMNLAVEALGINRRLALADPELPDLASAVIDSLVTVSEVHRRAGRHDMARPNIAEALTITHDLLRRDPGNRGALRDLLMCQVMLGEVDLHSGNFGSAQLNLEEALRVAQRMSREDPTDAIAAQAIEACNQMLADIPVRKLYAGGPAAPSVVPGLARIESAGDSGSDRIVANPVIEDTFQDTAKRAPNGDLSRHTIISGRSHTYHSQTATPTGDDATGPRSDTLSEEAHSALGVGLVQPDRQGFSESLSTPTTTQSSIDPIRVAYAHLIELARMEQHSGELQSARSHCAEALKLARQLASVGPEGESDLQECLGLAGLLETMARDPVAAEQHLVEAVRYWRRHAERRPEDSDAGIRLARSLGALATAQSLAGKTASAREHNEKALSFFRERSSQNPEDLDNLLDLSEALRRQSALQLREGELNEARTLAMQAHLSAQKVLDLDPNNSRAAHEIEASAEYLKAFEELANKVNCWARRARVTIRFLPTLADISLWWYLSSQPDSPGILSWQPAWAGIALLAAIVWFPASAFMFLLFGAWWTVPDILLALAVAAGLLVDMLCRAVSGLLRTSDPRVGLVLGGVAVRGRKR